MNRLQELAGLEPSDMELDRYLTDWITKKSKEYVGGTTNEKSEKAAKELISIIRAKYNIFNLGE
jgi:hypothetical protein